MPPDTSSVAADGPIKLGTLVRESLIEICDVLDGICEQLQELYEPHQALTWLVSPQPLLAGEKPLHLVFTGRSDEVLRLIAQMREGAYL